MVPVIMEPEVLYAVAGQEAPVPVGQGVRVDFRDPAVPDHLSQLVGQLYVPVGGVCLRGLCNPLLFRSEDHVL